VLAGEPLYRRALEARERVLGPEHPEVARLLNYLGFFLKKIGRPGESVPLFQRAIAIIDVDPEGRNPDLATYIKNLGEAFQDLGQLDDARPLFHRALDRGCRFLAETGSKHTFHEKLVKRYRDILAQMGRSEDEIKAELDAVASPYGISLDNC
jgi:tetratricopeptide (TPR) repeat protein